MFSRSLFYFMQETLNRQIPPDGKRSGVQGSWHPEGRNGYLERFEYIVDGERLDKEDRTERVSSAAPCLRLGVSRSVLVIKKTFQWRERMDASYLMIPDSCAQTSGMFVSVLHVSALCRDPSSSLTAAKLWRATPLQRPRACPVTSTV